MVNTHMELKQLEYFQMTSRLKNITKAAKRLKISQPNITVAIKKLEKELDVQLFDRSQKQFSLTPEGQVFFKRIDIALRNIKDAVIELNDYKQLQKGSIKIGIPSMIGAFLFPRIFSSFQERNNHLDIYLYEKGSITIREQIEQDELDFGIVITSNASKDFELLPITGAQLMICLPENHPLANSEYLEISDLAHEDIIMLKNGSYLRNMLLTMMEKQKTSPNIILESNQIETVKGLVSNNVGIAFLLDFVVQNSPKIKAVPFKKPIFIEIGLAWKKDRYISKAAQGFIEFCKDTFGVKTV